MRYLVYLLLISPPVATTRDGFARDAHAFDTASGCGQHLRAGLDPPTTPEAVDRLARRSRDYPETVLAGLERKLSKTA